ncbi:hypothetical protein HPB52_022527 [Rhipicephalus sanguineus]|uniref:Uncharacterized protein n=1 Tax=Rhipicephalus sanguineus TaxID=34632 RepID=A0A9D4PXT8_RHISA|nr:hypothetical protein HPB52_022527 [Rhipicephalus sanguineus]
MERKMSLMDQGDKSDIEMEDEDEFFLVQRAALNGLFGSALCPQCKEPGLEMKHGTKHGLPYSSPEGPTLAEAGDMPLPLSADIRALNHIGRMKRTHHGQQLIFHLDSLPHSRMGQCVAAYRALVSHSPDVNDLGVPPYRHRALTVRTNILGCVHYSEDRALIRSYREQGLATNSVDEFLFPSVHVDTVKRAFSALLNFFQSSALFERL